MDRIVQAVIVALLIGAIYGVVRGLLSLSRTHPTVQQRRTSDQGKPSWKYGWSGDGETASQHSGLDVRLAPFLPPGSTVTTDREALPYVRASAEAGNARACVVLGECLSDGIGSPQDFTEASKWYAAGAELGDANSMAALGTMYSIGQGVPQDFVRAHTWLNLAASRGDSASSRARDRLAKAMTPEDVALAQAIARRWDDGH